MEIEDNVFGSVIGKARRVKADEIDSPFLREGWTEDTYAHELIQDYAKSNTPKNPRSWTANQVNRLLFWKIFILIVMCATDLGDRNYKSGAQIRETHQVYWSQGRKYRGEACLRLSFVFFF